MQCVTVTDRRSVAQWLQAGVPVRNGGLGIKPRPHQQQCQSNIRLCHSTVERIVRLVAWDNVASTLLLVWYCNSSTLHSCICYSPEAKHMEIVYWAKNGVHAFGSARNLLKVNRFGWNLAYCEHIAGDWPWQILDAIRAVATVWEAADFFWSGR